MTFNTNIPNLTPMISCPKCGYLIYPSNYPTHIRLYCTGKVKEDKYKK